MHNIKVGMAFSVHIIESKCDAKSLPPSFLRDTEVYVSNVSSIFVELPCLNLPSS